MAYKNTRRISVRIYFSDSPSPVDVEGVTQMQTEGGLLRIITDDNSSQWWPLCTVFNIREIGRTEV